MRKNVASQVVGAQINSKTDGTPVTSGTTTVYVTGDGGTQGTGSVGSGACTHEGHGFWTYAPAQAETNYDHVAFTFENSSGVNATLQIYPSFPQTGDNYARIGAPAGASIAADIAAVKTDTAAVKVQTDKLTFTVANQVDSNVLDWKSSTAPAMTGDAFARLGAPAGASVSVDIAAVKTDTAAVKVKTDFLPSVTAGAAGGVFIAGANAATSITTALTANITGNVTGNLSGSVGSVTGAVGSVTGAVGSVTGSVGSVTGAVGSVTGLTASDVGAIKTQTDKLAFTVTNQVDANIQSVNDVLLQGTGAVGTDEWRKV